VIVPPSITTQPASVAIYQGQTTTLRVAAAGTSPTYQWTLNGFVIAGATAASWSTTTAGTYAVAVTNAAGSVLSSPAVVSYIGAPVISSQPTSASIRQGSTHTFSVTATGQDLQYQWQQIPVGAGPLDISGATSSSYTTGTAGTYRVLVRNPAGTTASSTATLTFTTPQPPVHDCEVRLPAPRISNGDVSDGIISIPVSNASDFSDALFESAPDLPACGLNTSSSRTWVYIRDAKTREQIYGFCALGRGADLRNIWVGQSSLIGPSIYIEMVDRACARSVISNTISVQQPSPAR
jgi:hypothetical protein